MNLVATRDILMQQNGIPRDILDRTDARRGGSVTIQQRHKLCYLLRSLPGPPSWPKIAKAMNCKTHSGIIQAANRYARKHGLPLATGTAGRPSKYPVPSVIVLNERPMFDDGGE